MSPWRWLCTQLVQGPLPRVSLNALPRVSEPLEQARVKTYEFPSVCECTGVPKFSKEVLPPP